MEIDIDLIKKMNNFMVLEPIMIDEPDAKLPDNPPDGVFIQLLSEKQFGDTYGITIIFVENKWSILGLTDEQMEINMEVYGLTEEYLEITRNKEKIAWAWIKKQLDGTQVTPEQSK